MKSFSVAEGRPLPKVPVFFRINAHCDGEYDNNPKSGCTDIEECPKLE